jgi:hypothetical protein
MTSLQLLMPKYAPIEMLITLIVCVIYGRISHRDRRVQAAALLAVAAECALCLLGLRPYSLPSIPSSAASSFTSIDVIFRYGPQIVSMISEIAIPGAVMYLSIRLLGALITEERSVRAMLRFMAASVGLCIAAVYLLICFDVSVILAVMRIDGTSDIAHRCALAWRFILSAAVWPISIAQVAELLLALTHASSCIIARMCEPMHSRVECVICSERAHSSTLLLRWARSLRRGVSDARSHWRSSILKECGLSLGLAIMRSLPSETNEHLRQQVRQVSIPRDASNAIGVSIDLWQRRLCSPFSRQW